MIPILEEETVLSSRLLLVAELTCIAIIRSIGVVSVVQLPAGMFVFITVGFPVLEGIASEMWLDSYSSMFCNVTCCYV